MEGERVRLSKQNIAELSGPDGLAAKLSKPKQRKKRGNEEDITQRTVVSWWSGYHSTVKIPERLLYANVNGAVLGHGKEEYQVKQRQIRGRLLKLAGLRNGVFDLFLAVARKGAHGLYLELKAGDNDTSKDQDMFMYDVRDQGYVAVVCWSAEDAINAIKAYLE